MTPASGRWDLVVVGAGPSGCAAALHARRMGLSVALLEGRTQPCRMPGETLHPGIEPVLARLGVREAVVAAGFHRHQGIWVQWDGPRRFAPYGQDSAGPWRGFQAPRARLQAVLQHAAESAGVLLSRSTRFQAICGLGSSDQVVWAGDRCWPTHWVADATGRRAEIATFLGVAAQSASPALRGRFWWEASAEAASEDRLDPSLSATPSGWTWRAPLGNGDVACVDVGVHATTTPPGAGIDLGWSLRRACAGPGYWLLGDAAAQLDPSSSHGVLRAMMSGMLAAHATADCLAGRVGARAATDAYRRWMRDFFCHDASRMRALYKRHPALDVANLFADDADAGMGRAEDGLSRRG